MSKYIPIYAVDFDGTLCESEWPGIGAPNRKLIEHLIKRQKDGAKIILWTCRVDERLQEAVEWCRDQGLEFDAVNDNIPELIEKYGGTNPRKITATVYIDDCAADKEKYGLPFHARVSVTDEKYQIGSQWVLKSNDFEVEVEVVGITRYRGNVSMRVKSISDNPKLKHYGCDTDIEWYKDKLFPIGED